MWLSIVELSMPMSLSTVQHCRIHGNNSAAGLKVIPKMEPLPAPIIWDTTSLVGTELLNPGGGIDNYGQHTRSARGIFQIMHMLTVDAY